MERIYKNIKIYIIFFIISIQTIFIYLIKGSGLDKKSNSEGFKIIPIMSNLSAIMDYLFIPFIPALDNLDKNVCFLEIDDKYNNIKISCDWCSICNGIIETAKLNIINNHDLLKKIDFEKLREFDKYLDYILIDRRKKLMKKQIEEWCQDTFQAKSSDLLLLSRIYLKVEMIELRWCPFKRSKQFYYRNKDKRFLNPTNKIIYEVGKILSKHDTITCNNCPKIVNDNWKYTKSDTKSIFQPLLDYMMEEIYCY